MPWQLANSDFFGYSEYRLYVFSVYWVCTVVTTVGYGDYAGGTTLEYMFTISLEFLGIIVFATLEVAVQQVVKKETFNGFLCKKYDELEFFLSILEKSNIPKNIPNDLYETIKVSNQRSIRKDFNMVVEEFDFYYKLTPKLQEQLVKVLFGSFINDFSVFFTGCEKQFINHMVVSLIQNHF